MLIYVHHAPMGIVWPVAKIGYFGGLLVDPWGGNKQGGEEHVSSINETTSRSWRSLWSPNTQMES